MNFINNPEKIGMNTSRHNPQEDLKEIREIEKETFLSKLKFCSYARNIPYLPHRTLKEFDWFIDECIFGKFKNKYPNFTSEWDNMINHFVKYCEIEYNLRYKEWKKQKAKQIAERNEFKGGCGKTHNGFTCTGKDFFCPDCQAKKKIQEINKELRNE